MQSEAVHRVRGCSRCRDNANDVWKLARGGKGEYSLLPSPFRPSVTVELSSDCRLVRSLSSSPPHIRHVIHVGSHVGLDRVLQRLRLRAADAVNLLLALPLCARRGSSGGIRGDARQAERFCLARASEANDRPRKVGLEGGAWRFVTHEVERWQRAHALAAHELVGGRAAVAHHLRGKHGSEHSVIGATGEVGALAPRCHAPGGTESARPRE